MMNINPASLGKKQDEALERIVENVKLHPDEIAKVSRACQTISLWGLKLREIRAHLKDNPSLSPASSPEKPRSSEEKKKKKRTGSPKKKAQPAPAPSAAVDHFADLSEEDRKELLKSKRKELKALGANIKGVVTEVKVLPNPPAAVKDVVRDVNLIFGSSATEYKQMVNVMVHDIHKFQLTKPSQLDPEVVRQVEAIKFP
jgi:hypothetical protein